MREATVGRTATDTDSHAFFIYYLPMRESIGLLSFDAKRIEYT